MTLSNFSEIPKYEFGQDGYGATTEISTKSNKRIYHYSSFNAQGDISQARNIEGIMEIIESEFSFIRISPKLNKH